MSLGRLTRQELGWLLAHEARGAAQTLRAEVKELRAVSALDDEDRVSSLPGELSLEALDNAIDVLGQLQPSARSRRRGRLDVAAILYELAPHWNVVLEPDAGTEVFGDEEEFRRLLQVLLTQSGEGTQGANARAVELRRDGGWVRISTPLGPDTAAAGEMERRWLARMALRLGGRYELHGKHQSLILPAETEDRLELQALRAELHQAQELGETYARELAQMLAEPVLPAASHNALRATAQREALHNAALALQHDPQRTQALLQLFYEQRGTSTHGIDTARTVELTEVLNAALHSIGEHSVDALTPEFVLELTPTTVLAEPSALQALLSALLLRAAVLSPRGARVVVRCFSAPLSVHGGEANGARVELRIAKSGGENGDSAHSSVQAFAALSTALLAERLLAIVETVENPTELVLKLTLRGHTPADSRRQQ